MLITHGVLPASSVSILDPPSQSGASNWLHRLCQGRGESVFYRRSCLFCRLTTSAIVGLGKAEPCKEMEKATFDRVQVRSLMHLPCQMKSLSMQEDPPMVKKETGTLFFFNFKFCIGAQPINDVVIVSDDQQRNPAIYTHASDRPQTSLPSRLPRNTEQRSLRNLRNKEQEVLAGSPF